MKTIKQAALYLGTLIIALAGILSPRIFTMLVIMAVITTMMTGPLLTLLGVRQPKMESPQEPSAA